MAPNDQRYLMGACDDKAAIIAYDGQRLEQVAELPFMPHAKGAVAPDGRFAVLAPDGASLSLGRVRGGAVEALRDFDFGGDWLATCVTHTQDRFYLGGAGRDHVTLDLPSGITKTVEVARPSVAVVDETGAAPALRVLEAPDFGRHRKWVDDLLIDGERLIAIDNVVEPKYYFTYRLDGAAPKLEAQGMLASHGPYERIKACAIGCGVVAILSHTSSGWDGYKHHLAIYDKDTMTQMTSLTLPNTGLKNTMCISGQNIYFADAIGVIGRVDIVKALLAGEGEGDHFPSAFTIAGLSPAEMGELFKRSTGRCLDKIDSRDLVERIEPDALQTCGQGYYRKAVEEGRDTDSLPPPIIALEAVTDLGDLVATWVDDSGSAKSFAINA